MIALIDYGAGNLHSVRKALVFLGADIQLATRPADLTGASAAVLPGVGAFDDCIHALERQDLIGVTRAFIESGRPFLGICVGYQALFEGSAEFNSTASGLGIFPGQVVRFSDRPGLKVPQIGWNQIELRPQPCPLYRGIANGSYVYFVHSFFPQPLDPALVASETEYGDRFASSIWKDNVYATQFHPEKSQKVGLQVLGNFLDLAGN